MTAWTVLLDQHRQSWAPGHCTLSGAGVGGEPVGKMAAQDVARLCSPERPLVLRGLGQAGSEGRLLSPGTHRLEGRMGIPGLGVCVSWKEVTA